MMRVMLLLLSVLSISAYGQSDSLKYQKFSGYGFRADRLWGYKVLLAPSDTTTNKLGIARIGSTLYVGNGTSWTAAGGSTTTLQQAITASGVLTQNNTIDASGYQLKFIADSLTFDTERLTINNRIFTPGLISGLATDSIVMRNPTTNRLHVVSPSRINALNTLATVTAAGNSTTDSVNIKTVANTPMVTITKRQGTPNLFGEIKLFDSTFSTSVPTVTIYGNSNGGIDASTFNVFNNTKSSRSQINYGGTSGSYIYTLPEATGAAVLSVNSQTANSAGNIKLTLFDSLIANTSAGLLIRSHSGSNIAQLGAGGGANVTWFGGNNFNSASGYSTNINGSLSGNNFTTVSWVDSLYLRLAGTGTTNYLAKYSGAAAIQNSTIYELSGDVGINTTTMTGTLNLTQRVNGSPTIYARRNSNTSGGSGFMLQFQDVGGTANTFTIDTKGAVIAGGTYTLTPSQGNLGQYMNVGDTSSTNNNFKTYLFKNYYTTAGSGSVFMIAPKQENGGASQRTLDITPRILHTGTAGFSIFRISPFLSTQGSGTKYLLDLGTNTGVEGGGTHTSLFNVATDGKLAINTTAATAYLDINSDVLRLRVSKTPSSATDTGNAGDYCWDANYIYICIATNTWRRVAHATW